MRTLSRDPALRRNLVVLLIVGAVGFTSSGFSTADDYELCPTTCQSESYYDEDGNEAYCSFCESLCCYGWYCYTIVCEYKGSIHPIDEDCYWASSRNTCRVIAEDEDDDL